MKPRLVAGIALAAIIAFPAAGWAQTKTNFSGTWTFDQTKSDPAPSRRGRGGGGRGGGPPVPMTLTITQTPSQIMIDRTMGPDGLVSGVYKLDGSESTNAMGDVFLSRSKVSWDGAKMVITTSKDMGMGPDGPLAEDSKETYGLDGGVLTVTVSTHNNSVPNGDQTRKLVYNKKS
jgi:hypothetical protein